MTMEAKTNTKTQTERKDGEFLFFFFSGTQRKRKGGEKKRTGSLELVHRGLANMGVRENAGGLDVIPLLAGKGVDAAQQGGKKKSGT